MIEGIVLIVVMCLIGPALLVAWDEWRHLRYERDHYHARMLAYRREVRERERMVRRG